MAQPRNVLSGDSLSHQFRTVRRRRTFAMPYPESCPECGGAFRNTGTHFTARRNEIGRHVLLELGCQNTTGRFWWDFTTGSLTEDGQPSPIRRANNGFHRTEANEHIADVIGHGMVSTL